MRDLNPKKARVAPPATRNRLKKPPRERKPLNLRPLVTWGGRIAGGAALVAVLFFACRQSCRILSKTVFFAIKKIEVVNNRRLSTEAITALAGLKPGDDLLRISPKTVGEHLEKNPWIERVRVRRYFPGTISIDVTERVPVAIVNLGYLCYLDSRGEIFKPLNEGDSLNFPVITGLSEEEMGKDPAAAGTALKSAADMVALLRQGTGFRLEDVSELHYDKGFGFTLFTSRGGVPVKVGSDGFPEKLSRLARIYRDIQGEVLGLEYIDVNYSDRIVVKKG